MIFTGQENIDDVIFSPMMRPTVSPLNSQIYGIAEPSLAPVEDLALAAADFESLCRDQVLKPHASHILVKPHIRFWQSAPGAPILRVSGHAELEGFLESSVLRLAGYQLKSETPLTEEDARTKALELIDSALVQFLRKQFPNCQVTVSPSTVLHPS